MTTTLPTPNLAITAERFESEGFELPRFPQPDIKAPHTRRLDLLAGWANFILEDGYPDAEGVEETVCDLYQQAGAMQENGPEAVRAFVVERVLPALLRRE